MIELLKYIMTLSFWNKVFLFMLLTMFLKVLIVCVTIVSAMIYGIITGEDVIIK